MKIEIELELNCEIDGEYNRHNDDRVCAELKQIILNSLPGVHVVNDDYALILSSSIVATIKH